MKPANALERFWMGLVSSVGCVVCRRFEPTGLPPEVHHIAKGSGARSHFAVACLCGNLTDGGHHRGGVGFHGMGDDAFCRLFRPPGDSEWGLLVWTIEDIAAKLKARFGRALS